MHFDLYAKETSHKAWLFDAYTYRDANDLAAVLSRTLRSRVVVYRNTRPMVMDNMAKNSQIATAAAARNKAQATLEQRERIDAEFFRQRKKQEAENLEKTKRLKSLRLAKEAADQEAVAARTKKVPMSPDKNDDSKSSTIKQVDGT